MHNLVGKRLPNTHADSLPFEVVATALGCPIISFSESLYHYFSPPRRNEKLPMFFNAMQVPRAIARNGSSAMCTGRPDFFDKRWSRPLIRAPPPAR
jgi:hypothetical protein